MDTSRLVCVPSSAPITGVSEGGAEGGLHLRSEVSEGGNILDLLACSEMLSRGRGCLESVCQVEVLTG